MRSMAGLAAAVLIVASASVVRADDDAASKALVEKAMKAHGGETKIVQFKAETFKAKGKFYGIGDGVEYTGEWSLQSPDKMRVRIESGAGNMKFTFLRVLNGDKMWLKAGDKTQAVENKDEIAEEQEAAYVRTVTALAPLKGKGFAFAPLGEIKVDGKPAVGVRVSHKGHRDVNLFFDKDRGLLVKSETMVKDVMAGDKELTQETLYENYKDVSGAQHPMKITINRDGKKYIEAEVTEIEPRESFDDSVFAKP
jgi:outer membrane lipoprotein-sorting protein